MPIHKPGRVLLHHIPLKFVSSRVAGGGRKALDMSIPLVPFIDFLITLVVFLLMSFSASGELVQQKKNIKMPKAANAVDLDQLPIVSVAADYVMYDGRRVGDYNTLKSDPKIEPIDKLVTALEDTARTWKISHPKEDLPASIILQADEHVDYRVIKKVMLSAAKAGFADISFAVNKKAGATSE